MSCPNAEAFAEFADGRLASGERAAFESHIDQCGSCRVLIAELTRAELPGETSEPELHRIGRFRIEHRLGEGAMGVVYLASDPTLRRKVAIKVMRPRLLLDQTEAVTLVSEAQAAARLNHPNAVTVHEVGRHDERLFIVMEFVSGSTLRQLIEGKLHWRKAIELLVGAGRGLQAAHEAGLIHRDFKPDNVIVGEDGRPRVTDFGLARIDEKLPADASLRLGAITANTTGAGTPIYMAAEQLLGDGASALSDQYAFAVTAYQTLYGSLPHYAESLAALTHQVITEPVPEPDPSSLVPSAVFTVLKRALSVEARDRFSSVSELLEKLIEAANGDSESVDENRDVPFPGLVPFGASDASRYFGRRAEIERAEALLDRGLLAIAGPSGVGKSSFVRAGLFPQLDRGGAWQLIALRPGRRPMLSVATEIAKYVDGLEPPAALAHHLAREPAYLSRLLDRIASRDGLLLFVDQFEELYTLAGNPAERDAFARAIAEAARPRDGSSTRVVIALRSDFIDRVADQRILADPLAGGFLFLPAPDRALLQDALVSPIERFGYSFEDDAIVSELITGLLESAAPLPLLQFVAARMWATRDRSARKLTRASYREVGVVDEALAAHADAFVRAFAAQERDLVRRLFVRLVTADGTRDVVAAEELCSLAPGRDADMARIIERLAQERLVVVRDGASGESAVELIHESLIRNWPTLAHWLVASKAHAARLAELRGAARNWDRNDRSPGLLWAGDMAAVARTIATELSDQLGARERAFVEAIQDAHDRSRRSRRLRRIVVTAVLSLVAVGASAAAIWVGRAEARAQDQRDIAETEARRARAAEREKTAKIEALESEKRQRRTAESTAAAATKSRDASRLELEESNIKLRSALRETAAAKNRLDQKRADLEQANRGLERANAALEKKLAEERKRRRAQERLRKELADGL